MSIDPLETDIVEVDTEQIQFPTPKDMNKVEKKKWKNTNGVDEKRKKALLNLEKARQTRKANAMKKKQQTSYRLPSPSDSESETEVDLGAILSKKKEKKTQVPKTPVQSPIDTSRIDRIEQALGQIIDHHRKLAQKPKPAKTEKIVVLQPTNTSRSKTEAKNDLKDQTDRILEALKRNTF